MERRPFGAGNPRVSVIGQGTWKLEAADRAEATATLRRGIELGMTHVDTAEMYGAGAAERWVGEAIAGLRDEVFLVSKVLPEHATRAGTIGACENSLRRLRTDRLDAYLLHWRGAHPLEDAVAAFEELERAGKIRAWGVSNFDVPDLEDVAKLARAGRPACNQVLYHLKERAVEHAVLPWCERHGVAVVGYSPFAQGRFPGPRTSGRRVLERIAKAHGATARQVALRFLVRRPSLFTIPKASSPEHAAENAEAGRLQLSEPELAEIEAAFPLARRPRELPTT